MDVLFESVVDRNAQLRLLANPVDPGMTVLVGSGVDV
jgi:hypothetical protein